MIGRNRRRTTVELLAVKSLACEDISKYNFRVRALDKNRESSTTKDNCASWVDVTVTDEDINDNTPVLCRKYSQTKVSGNPYISNMYCVTDSHKLNLKFCNGIANTMIAQIDAASDDKEGDDEEGDNGPLGISISMQKRKWDADDDTSLRERERTVKSAKVISSYV